MIAEFKKFMNVLPASQNMFEPAPCSLHHHPADLQDYFLQRSSKDGLNKLASSPG